MVDPSGYNKRQRNLRKNALKDKGKSKYNNFVYESLQIFYPIKNKY